MSKTYELTQFQYDQMVGSANAEYAVFALLEPNLTDTPTNRAEMEQNVKDMDALIEIGLMKDISEAFRQDIDQSVAARDRSYRVLRPTEDGLKMFRGSAKRLPN